jgi:hypothetical protein
MYQWLLIRSTSCDLVQEEIRIAPIIRRRKSSLDRIPEEAAAQRSHPTIRRREKRTRDKDCEKK